MTQKKIYRKGIYGEKQYKFTHRNPQTGEVYSPFIPVQDKREICYGKWVDPSKVKWVS